MLSVRWWWFEVRSVALVVVIGTPPLGQNIATAGKSIATECFPATHALQVCLPENAPPLSCTCQFGFM